jgi:mannan endo-1,4-beta-mannosidase
MRLIAAAACVVVLAACQLVAGITDGSSHGPCTTSNECPATESCEAGHCQAKSTNSGGSAGTKAAGSGGSSATGGRQSSGGSSGKGGTTASGGTGLSQAGTTAAGGAGGGAGASGGGRSGGADRGDAGDGAAGETTGAVGGGGTGGGSGGTGGTGGTAGGGVGGAGRGGAGGAGAGGSAGATAGSGGNGMAGAGGAGPIRIMPLGDGITASTCMRAFLWKELSDNAYPAFDFVGTRTSADACSPTEYDKNHEGHAGYRVSDLLSATSLHTDSGGDPYTGSSADLAAWFDGRPADIVLMLFGSNDFLNTMSSAADVQNAYSAILAKLRSVNARVTLLVGLLPPMSTDKCNTSCASRRSDLNAAMPGWATSASTATSRVVVVDLSTGFDLANTTDGVKPSDVGAQFLADRWYAALSAL